MRPTQTHPLRAWLKTQGVTQQALADALGCDRTTLLGVMAGRQRPSRGLAEKISRVTGVQIEIVWSGSFGEYRQGY